MTSFDRLHPLLQYHVVNSLGWARLRPVQEQTIDAVLAGDNVIVLAPTAGGKTEAAFFPLLSETLTHDWRGVSVLYVSPIKALLNNQVERLERYYGLVGRRTALWHGDVLPAARRRIVSAPPDCLLTTPESVEGMLVAPTVPHRELFAGLRAVVVDETHAFAGDDRGWHLLGVLARLSRLAGRDIQRIGLSATVGNPDDLVTWLAAGSNRPSRVIRPASTPHEPAPDVTLDYVDGLENAATVITRLYRGEKRLVFCDSRSRVEQLAARLRSAGVNTFVTHSSLSLDERRQAEGAFSTGRDCVIVATSTLELGVDVGDLDRVIQIDAPATVSSFLQRMGRSGRRPGTSRNCLLLATTDDALLKAAGLLRLWRSGYIEPVVPPPEPCHVFAQQVLGLVLQTGGIASQDWQDWVGPLIDHAAIPRRKADAILNGMLAKDILFEDGGVLGIGATGEKLFGRKNYLELLSVFTAPPEFTVYHGTDELGSVHESTFDSGPAGWVLLLAGRAWRAREVDRARRKAYVEPAAGGSGRSVWRGEGPWLSWELCRTVASVLSDDGVHPGWSRRAQSRIQQIRQGYPWADGVTCPVVSSSAAEHVWWTFGGYRTNRTLAHALRPFGATATAVDNFALTFGPGEALERFMSAIPGGPLPRADSHEPPEDLAARMKFSDCLSPDVLTSMSTARSSDSSHVGEILRTTRKVVSE